MYPPFMIFAHFADLQLGFNRFDGRYSETRERDFERVWEAAVAACLERSLDAVLIAGDVYQHTTPSSSARVAMLRGVIDLLEDGITVVVGPGNHETPRKVSTTHPLEELRVLSKIYPESLVVCIDEPVTKTLDSVIVHLIPWVHGQPLTYKDFNVDADIVMVHAACEVIPEYREAGRTYRPEWGEDFRYVALGDWHGAAQVGPNAFYAGSLERTSFGEANLTTGGYFVTLTPDETKVEHWESPARPMRDHVVTEEDDNEAVLALVSAEDPEHIHRVTFVGVDPTEVSRDTIQHIRAVLPLSKVRFTERPLPPALMSFGPAAVLKQWRQYADEAELKKPVYSAGKEALEVSLSG